MSNKITLDFSNVFSANGVEKALRKDPIPFLKHLYHGKKTLLSGEEFRIGNKGSFVVYLSDFHWCSYDPSEPVRGYGLINLAQEEWCVKFKDALARCAAFLKKHDNSKTSFKPFAQKTSEQQEQVKRKNKLRAVTLIDSAAPIGGTVAERYLRKRHIDTKKLPASALRQLGYVASCYHRETKSNFPALLATLRNCESERVAVHRIYLSKNADKAQITPNKSTLAQAKGASVHLTPAREWLILTEGLEDGLSVLLGVADNRKYGVWCGIGSTLTGIVIPKDTVRCVVLAVDNDNGGRGFIKELAPRLTQEGFCVFIAVPTHGKDFNEMLCRYSRLFNNQLMEKYND